LGDIGRAPEERENSYEWVWMLGMTETSPTVGYLQRQVTSGRFQHHSMQNSRPWQLTRKCAHLWMGETEFLI
jgi:hypothetical protein